MLGKPRSRTSAGDQHLARAEAHGDQHSPLHKITTVVDEWHCSDSAPLVTSCVPALGFTSLQCLHRFLSKKVIFTLSLPWNPSGLKCSFLQYSTSYVCLSSPFSIKIKEKRRRKPRQFKELFFSTFSKRTEVPSQSFSVLRVFSVFFSYKLPGI